ncbi:MULTISPECIES: LysR family transcriptional regulator [Atopobiaceae]|jgi:DNA-binding transcriptional LysR family regulator|uniref:LysR family transcriptional regulator n=1 Tax=Tractidigestivibacter scatoligenes TaxID=1299998 RepID=A0A117J4V4_TRASO|nr:MULTISPECIES: LysR family transcriptional regulator [Atopobiaceae]KUH59456.1 LysR family transcriptional regulator [Tractidigestivibacter scatoligenes]SFW98390.1 DNA-binding transcriptional regulator, LysR family [Olsenella sp. kh2p3]
MTLQQLRYVVEVATAGSITAASQRLFIAQPSLSKAISELESEMGITIFERSSKGVVPTEDGTRFLSYARQVVEQADLLEAQYKHGMPPRRVFGVSSQHYAFVVNAFAELVREHGESRYEFSLREGTTFGTIEDVRLQRSELGVLYRNDFNREVLTSAIRDAELRFEPLFEAREHVFVSRTNPLAARDSVTLADLAPYPRLSYDQGSRNSFYFAEEPHITEQVDKAVVVTDRATLFNLLIGLDGYTISSGILSVDLNGENIVAVPLEDGGTMELGYIHQPRRPLSPMAERYLEHLSAYVAKYIASGYGRQ